MAEYIEREAALAEQKLYNTYASAEMAVPVEALWAIPAADVVSVVRCGDCKYGKKTGTEMSMGVYIRGMEMPTEGEYRMTLYVFSDGSAGIDVASFPEGADRFEAVPVPPHGDLIDRAALRESFRESIEACHKWADEMREAENEEMVIRAEQSLGTFVECSLRAKSAPTIIPAEEGE